MVCKTIQMLYYHLYFYKLHVFCLHYAVLYIRSLIYVLG